MALTVTLIPQNLDPNVCYPNEQTRFNDFVQHTQGTLPDGFTPVIISSTAPGPDQRTFLWAKVDGNNAIQDVLTFSNGSWNGLPKPWIPGEYKEYDPSHYTPVAPWFPCDGTVAGVLDRRGTFTVCAGQRVLPVGSTDQATNFIFGTVVGRENTFLIAANLPAHSHTLIGFANQFIEGGGGGTGVKPNTGQPQVPGYIAGGNTTGNDGSGNPNLPIPVVTFSPAFPVNYMQWRPDLV